MTESPVFAENSLFILSNILHIYVHQLHIWGTLLTDLSLKTEVVISLILLEDPFHLLWI